MNAKSSLGASCPICGSKNSVPAAHPDYSRCECGTVYQTTAVIQVSDYYAEIEKAPDFRRQRGSYKTYLSRVSLLLGDLREHAFIDVGGGDGLFAQMAQEELSPRSVAVAETSEKARSKLRDQGVEIIELDQIFAVEKKIVSALQVLEHIAEPEAFIKSFGLRKGDYLVLTSPSTDTIYYRLYGKHWRSYAPSHHLILYSREGLERLLGRLGIELLHFEHCVSGVHSVWDEAVRFAARVLFWPLRRFKSSFYDRVQLFHGKASFLAIAKIK